MTVLGITAEYNPFHNGHLHHLERSKELCGADSAVCVMSGNFIQRGEPAVVDKWVRTEMALRSGIDLVVELPLAYAMSSAEFFSFGAVKILHSLGIVDYISFGSEAGNLDQLSEVADVLSDEPEEYRSLLRAELAAGISYPAARQAALFAYLSCSTGGNSEKASAAETLSHSNNILGVEYLKALKKLSSRMKPLTVPRLTAAYNSEELTGSISSATAIRKLISRSCGEPNEAQLNSIMPESSAGILVREFTAGRGPVFSKDFDGILLSLLRRMSVNEIKALPYVTEGLENRIADAAASSGTVDELVQQVCTRRYTRTRIQRILFSILAGLTSLDLQQFQENGGPGYIRILGFNEKGRELMGSIKKNAGLPIIMKAADYRKIGNSLDARMMEIEAAATDQYVLAFGNRNFRQAGQEFTRNIVRI